MRFKGLFLFVLLLLATSLAFTGCAPKVKGTPTPGPSGTGVQAATQPTKTLGPSASPTTSQALPSVAGVVEKVRPAVVFISVRQIGQDFFLRPIPTAGTGSGVIFDEQGHILTNNHVIEDAQDISVILPDGRRFDTVKVIGRDPSTDLAVLQIEGNDLPVAPLGESSRQRVGDWVIAIGNALGLRGGPTVTVGVISALDRQIEEPNGVVLYDLIQTDAAINPGNSGGPLVNLVGEVIGINTAIEAQATGIGFAVSIDSAKPVMQQLLATGKVSWPWIGIEAMDITPSLAEAFRLPVTEGVLVRRVVRGGPAAQAGLRAQDIITGLNGDKTSDTAALRRLTRQHKVGDKVNLTFLRNGKEQTVAVALQEEPQR